MLEQCYCQRLLLYYVRTMLLSAVVILYSAVVMLEQCYCQRLLLYCVLEQRLLLYYVRTMLLSAVVIILC